MRLKVAYLFIFCLALSCKNESKQVDYDISFLKCPLTYDLLVQNASVDKKKGDTYFYKGEKYSGCAKQDFKEKKHYSVYQFVDGFLRKEYVYFYNGKLAREFSFKKSLRHGVLRMYFEDGTPYVEEYYDQGEADGKHLKWHNNETLAREASYKNGKLKGEKIYDRQGKLISEKK